MDLLIVLTYVALAWAVFKIFRIPVNQWTLATAALGGVFLVSGLILLMNYNHPYTFTAQKAVIAIPITPQVTGIVTEVTDKNNQLIQKTRSIQTRFTIKAPIDGVITAFDLRTGMNISKDKVVAQIQGMDPVWISAAVPESIAYLLKDTSQFEISVPAYPDKTFHVEKWNILPSVDQTTRTLQVRLQVSNKDEFLKPGMNAYLKLNTRSQEMLLIPSQAVIDTGKEQRVITVDDEGKFVPKQIHVLHESQQQSGIGSGLNEGDTVVVSGLFLIDSEANITGALERMRHPEKTESSMPAMSDQPVNMHSGH